jgi:hypothetical protein
MFKKSCLSFNEGRNELENIEEEVIQFRTITNTPLLRPHFVKKTTNIEC